MLSSVPADGEEKQILSLVLCAAEASISSVVLIFSQMRAALDYLAYSLQLFNVKRLRLEGYDEVRRPPRNACGLQLCRIQEDVSNRILIVRTMRGKRCGQAWFDEVL